jgi:hypothetical protein
MNVKIKVPFRSGTLSRQSPRQAGINRRDWLHAVAQLSENRLIDWTPLEDRSGMGLLSGFAKINDLGVKVLEAGVAAPISISIDRSQKTSVPRPEQVPIGPIGQSTPQQQMITEALEKVITAIKQADVSEQEKNEAKSLLRKLLASKAAARVLGLGAQSSPRNISRNRAGSIHEIEGPTVRYRAGELPMFKWLIGDVSLRGHVCECPTATLQPRNSDSLGTGIREPGR